jgi:dienelactone hydrolase
MRKEEAMTRFLRSRASSAVTAAILFGLAMDLAAQGFRPPSPRAVNIPSSDGTVLKATFCPAANPGPGVALFHQSNRTRGSWADVAGRLAAAGIHALIVDMRGHGETGGAHDNWTDPDKDHAKQTQSADLDAIFQFLTSQPGVQGGVIGVAGAGVEGVDNAVQLARRHTAAVRSLVMVSGETFQEGLQFLKDAAQLPELFIVADADEYPPTVEAMELLYVTASSPSKKLVHYVAPQEAPWRWYEPVDVGKVPPAGAHGTDLFAGKPELPGLVVDWFVRTLIQTPGRAPADTIGSAAVIREIQSPGGAARVTQQLLEARQKDPHAQLFPEISVSIVGFDHLRAGDPASAVEVLKLVALAYPDSADAHGNLADAYLRAGQKDLARQEAQKAIALLDSRKSPASSWTDSEPYRGEIRRGAQQVLDKTR